MANDESEWLDLAAVVRATTLSGKTISRMIAKGEFPEPIRVGDGARRWLRSDLEWWKLHLGLRHRLRTDGTNLDKVGQTRTSLDKRGTG